jgi:hypothetical protein
MRFMTNIKKPSFGRPGRPHKIELSDLFLWHPMIEKDLVAWNPSSLEGIFDECPDVRSLCYEFGRKRKISDVRAKEILGIMVDFFSKNAILKNLDFDKIKEQGYWYAFIYGSNIHENGAPSLLAKHVVDIEKELTEPTQAWRENDMTKCADLLTSACPTLSNYLWPEFIEGIRTASTDEQILRWRVMVTLELYLSFLAHNDSRLQFEGLTKQSMFCNLFPDISAPKSKHPNALFFDWLASYSGVKEKLADLISQPNKPSKDNDIESIKRALRRWRSGERFPSSDVLDDLFQKLFDSKHESMRCVSWEMASATKRINFLMDILSLMNNMLDIEKYLPHQHNSIQSWRENRYPHWYQYWLSHHKNDS